MSSMVSEYIIRPALQQVRRFSRSSIASESESASTSPRRKSRERPSSREDAISETDEDSYLKDEGDESALSRASSRSSVTPNLAQSAGMPVNRRSELAASQSGPASSSRDATPVNAELSPTMIQIIEGANSERSDDQVDSLNTPDTSLLTESAAAVPSSPVSVTMDRHTPLPEDDGMGTLRRRILDIQAMKLPAAEQARLMHILLMEGYAKSQIAMHANHPLSPTSAACWEQKEALGRLESFKFWQDYLGDASSKERFVLTAEDVKPTFAPLDLEEQDDDPEYRALGCEHYKRNVKSQCSTCGHWYTCRFCHDKVESHVMVPKDSKNMLCMFCEKAQKAGEACVSCGESAAMYYCSICKLWNNDPDKSIYHCADCGICRIGRGLGKDYFHCKKCNACLAISLENDHRCIERLLDCDCPICGEYMFNSHRGVCNMKCGHALHRDCWTEHIKHAYKCPICNKSIVNMETQFRNLDVAIETQPMPEKFQDTRAVVLCNDCSARTSTKYHWLGLKCAVCQSYNTSQLQILGVEAESLGTTTANASESQLPESTGDGLRSTQPSAARDIARRRRHSSNLLELSTENLGLAHDIGSYVVQDRFARSVSPVTAGFLAEAEDFEEDEDMIGFWSIMPRSALANEHPNKEYDSDDDSDDDSVSSLGDGADDDEDEDEDEINLFGHR